LLRYKGFLGDGNFGDELVYEAAKKILEPAVLVPGVGRYPIFTGFFVAIRFFDFRGDVLGGGTLIGPNNELIDSSEAIFVHGTGARKYFSNDWIKSLSSKTLTGGVRGRTTAGRLAETNKVFDVIGDAAFCLFDESKVGVSDCSTILLNFGTHHDANHLIQSRAEIQKFVSLVLELGVKVEYLPMHNIDVRLGKDLKIKFPEITLHSIPRTYEEAVNIFRGVSFAVGERLHFAVMSVLLNCPITTIVYDEKHSEFLESIDSLDFGLMPADVSADSLLDRFNRRANGNWEAVNSHLLIYKSKQIRAANEYLDSLGIRGKGGFSQC
jgi:polysaccharide pyruvyl transferase WcaK-like protein